MDKEKIILICEKALETGEIPEAVSEYTFYSSIIKELERKREPVKPVVKLGYRGRNYAWCSNCSVSIRYGVTQRDRENYCHHCGVPIDWNIGGRKHE